MAYKGKYVDRFPEVMTAGLETCVSCETAASCLNFPVTETDVADVLLKKISKATQGKYVCPPQSGINYSGSSQVKELLSGKVKTGFEAFRAELRETSYKSYWTKEVGAVPDPVPNLPVGMNPEATTFGRRQVRSEPAGEVLNPRKCTAFIDAEYLQGREFYKTSHNSYLPGEQKRTMNPPLPSNLIFGKITEDGLVDFTGKKTKRILQWIDQSQVSMTSQSLAEQKDTLYYPLGKGRVRTGVPAYVTKNSTFGAPSYLGEEIVRKTENEMLPLHVAYIGNLKRQINKKGIDLVALRLALRAEDKDNTKEISRDTVYKVVGTFKVYIDSEYMDPTLRRLQILKDDKIHFMKFVSLLDIKDDFPDFGRGDHPVGNFTTEYQDLYSQKVSNPDKPAAGIPAFRFDFPFVTVPTAAGWCSVQQGDIPDQTSADDVLRPHIFTHFGLSHYDLFQSRSKDFIRELFAKTGVKIPENVFDLMWAEGLRRDGCVSVETFRNILDEVSTGKLQLISVK